jgi:hypothetical protein
MWSHLARATAATALALIPMLAPAASVPASAYSLPPLSPAIRGQDVCPEPNDTFQKACFLGKDSDALGFISRPNDVDAYRIEVYDFNTDVHVEMPTMPAPYKIELANWNGDVIASSDRNGSAEVIDTTVDLPGAYYIFVHSASGGFSDTQPYQIFRALTYPGSSIPDRIFASDFREGAKSAVEGESEYAIHSEDGGRYTIQMKISGDGRNKNPSEAWWTGFGPEVTDFTMTLDTRVTNGADGGSSVFFRHVDNDNTYQFALDSKVGSVQLWKIVKGEVTGTGWTSSDVIDTKGGVNRIVIRCFEDDILVNVNGDDLIQVSDGTFRKGRIGIGAMTYGGPATVSFDNIIITTPSEG